MYLTQVQIISHILFTARDGLHKGFLVQMELLVFHVQLAPANLATKANSFVKKVPRHDLAIVLMAFQWRMMFVPHTLQTVHKYVFTDCQQST